MILSALCGWACLCLRIICVTPAATVPAVMMRSFLLMFLPSCVCLPLQQPSTIKTCFFRFRVHSRVLLPLLPDRVQAYFCQRGSRTHRAGESPLCPPGSAATWRLRAPEPAALRCHLRC